MTDINQLEAERLAACRIASPGRMASANTGAPSLRVRQRLHLLFRRHGLRRDKQARQAVIPRISVNRGRSSDLLSTSRLTSIEGQRRILRPGASQLLGLALSSDQSDKRFNLLGLKRL